MAETTDLDAVVITQERRRLKRELTLLPLFGLIYFTVCGGSFGIEPLVGWSGPGLALLLVFLTPLVFSIPNMLMVRELQSMMPVEGGYYHWVKQAFFAQTELALATTRDLVHHVARVRARWSWSGTFNLAILPSSRWADLLLDALQPRVVQLELPFARLHKT